MILPDGAGSGCQALLRKTIAPTSSLTVLEYGLHRKPTTCSADWLAKAKMETCAAGRGGKAAGQRVLASGVWLCRAIANGPLDHWTLCLPTRTMRPRPSRLRRALVLHATKKRWLPSAAHWSRTANSHAGTEIICTLFHGQQAHGNINCEIVRRLLRTGDLNYLPWWRL
jgi:hypothetical protein